MLFLLGILFCLPQLVLVGLGCWLPDASGLRSWLRTAGWLSLWALPAVLAQVFFNALGGSASSFNGGELLGMMPWAWTVLLGGASVQAVFEATAEAVSGHRQSTMLDNWPWYLALTWLQLSLLSLFVSLQRRGPDLFRDRTALFVGVLVLLNAGFGIPWPWWGS